MSCNKYKKLETYIKKLNVDGFKKEYEEITENEDIDICILSKILMHYPEVNSISELTDEIIETRKNNVVYISDMINHILLDAFCFDNSIIRKKHDEIIKFENLYDIIGWSYIDPLDGNTLSHHQVAGLHVDGINLITYKERKLNYMGLDIKNKNGNTPLEVMFLEEHIAFEEKNSIKQKSIILDMLLEFHEGYNFKSNDNIFFRTLFFQIVTLKKINIYELYLLIEKFNISNDFIQYNLENIFPLIKKDNIRGRRIYSIIKKKLSN